MASSHLSLFRESFRLCTTEVACDGATLTAGRTMCVRCEEALKKRNAAPKPLRGERCVTSYQREKAKKQKKRRSK